MLVEGQGHFFSSELVTLERHFSGVQAVKVTMALFGDKCYSCTCARVGFTDNEENPKLMHMDDLRLLQQPYVICSRVEWRVCDLEMEPALRAST